MCGVSAILTDPEPVCTGDTVILTCTISGGMSLVWRYNGALIGNGPVTPEQLPPDNPDIVGGVEFTLSMLDSSPDLVSQLSFTASTDMDGGIVQCAGSDGTTGTVSDDTVIQVEQICKSFIH